MPPREAVLKPRYRVMVGATIALGPGKVRLLELIAETGSLNRAAARMDMSYMRAWSLVRTMNRCFASPVVELRRGGRAGGGTRLTPLGRHILFLYNELEKSSAQAESATWAKLRRCLAP
jgi:molybdate transport system regulatory protein